MKIEPYHLKPIQYLPYDPLLPQVSDAVAQMIIGVIPDAHPVHIGSTAVPEMPGKNSINLIIPSSFDQFNDRLSALEQLGFQESPLNKVEPPTRPLRVGSVMLQDKPYLVHVHLVVKDSNDYAGAVFFRDYLKTHPQEAQQYAHIKRVAVASGKTDAASYNKAKEPFIRSVLAKRSD